LLVWYNGGQGHFDMLAKAARLGLILSTLLLSTRVRADGVYVPEMAYPTMPAIPLQRALISYHEGMETLIVESTFQSPARNVGWILPMPAKPTKLALADGGMLTSVSMSMRPQITHDLHGIWGFLVSILVASIPPAAVIILTQDPKKRRRRIMITCLLYLLVLLPSILLPMLGREEAVSAMPDVLSSQRLGDYQVTVLRADDADALSNWLKTNGLTPLSAAAKPIIDDYASRKWYFLVARLSQDATGPATPMPIAATFPASAPVFPMKLTALADTTTRVELMVVGDREAIAQGFHCVAADSFQLRDGRTPFEGATAADYYEASYTGLIIGSPDAQPWMWDGCTVTNLTADLSPSQMSGDVPIGLTDLLVYRDHFYSTEGRLEIIASILLIGGIISLAIASYVFTGCRRPSRRQIRASLAFVALIPIAAVIAYVELPVVPVHASRVFMNDLRFRSNALGAMPNILDSNWVDEFLNRLQKDGEDINPYTGSRRQLGRTPGNFSTREIADRTYFCIYDADGRETRIEFPKDAANQK
jgi:hypothetical protein